MKVASRVREDRREILAHKGFWGVVTAQFFGAFNDNGFRFFLQALALDAFTDERQHETIIALAAVFFLLPYLVFSMHAGRIADHFSKREVLKWAKVAECCVMALGIFAFIQGGSLGTGSFVYLFFVLFLMGTQSTYYAPAKYSILPEMLPERHLSWANGIFELSGFIAIILGGILGAHFAKFFEGAYYLASVSFVTTAFLGFLGTLVIPKVPPARAEQSLRFDPLGDLKRRWKTLLAHRQLLFSVFGVAFIWSLGLLFQLDIIVYAKHHLGMPKEWIGYPMAVVAVGVGLGSFAAGYLSGKRIELALVVVGGIGLGLSACALYFTLTSPAATLGMILVAGFFAGFLVVPFHAHVQAESPEEAKGALIALTNWLQTAGMIVASAVFLGLSAAGLSPAEIYLVSGLGTLVLTGAVVTGMPALFARFILWTAERILVAVKVEGVRLVNTKEPLLLYAEGLSTWEALLLLVAATHRPVRLLRLDAGGGSGPLERRLGRLLGAREVESVEALLESAAAELRRGGQVLAVADGLAEPLRRIAAETGARFLPVRAARTRRIRPALELHIEAAQPAL